MSKIEAGKFKIVKEPFDVAPLVKSCCDLMRHTAEQRSLSLIMDVAPGIPELPADKRACKQMLINVISNAIKFTDPGGWVRVSARRVEGTVEFSVADNGIGIGEADLPKLGNPFVQANNSYDRSYDGRRAWPFGGEGLGEAAWRPPRADQQARGGDHRHHRPAARSRRTNRSKKRRIEPPAVSAA